MRGQVRLWEIIKPLCVTGGRVDDRLAGVLRSTLLHDCLEMAVHPELAACLRSHEPHAWRVIATDNAAVFDEAFRRARLRRRLADWARPGTMCELAGEVDGLLEQAPGPDGRGPRRVLRRVACPQGPWLR